MLEGEDLTLTGELLVDTIKANTDDIDFNTGGLQRMRINSDGELGIGVTNPLSTLEVKRNTQATGIHTVATLSTLSANYDYGVALDFSVDWGGYINTGKISSVNVAGGDGYGGELRFSTNGQSIDTMTERMKIDALGRVIINNIPTSSSGLPTGAIYSDGGTLKIV